MDRAGIEEQLVATDDRTVTRLLIKLSRTRWSD